MKKLYTLLVVALIGFMGNAQIVNIPDAAFKAKLLSASATINVASSQPLVYNSVTNTYSVSSYNKIDTNNDGQIQISEAQAITYLNLINPTSPFLNNITGIQSFTSLQYLDCSDVFYASFTNLNLSQNTALKYLNCSNNSLTQLNITGLSNLQTLFCNYNNLTNLNFSGYSALLNLNCSNNQLATLNLFGNNALTYLVCNNNVITTPLNLVGYNSLKTLNCSLNKIPSIDLTGINSITDINCGSNFF
jgi:Leucine-rich repeat (LRR) protein